MGLKQRARARSWRSLGFALSEVQMTLIEDFFGAWFTVYNLPGTDCYRSQLALFGVHRGVTAIAGDRLPDWERRQAVSAVRAGYCVAAVEAMRRDRSAPDPHLKSLFAAMDEHETPCRDRHD